MSTSRVLPHLAWPILGAVFAAFWIIGEYGRTSFENNLDDHSHVISWWSTVAALAVAIGIARLLPLVSGAVAVVVLVVQFFYEPAQFTANSWPVYFAYGLIVVAFSAYAPSACRKTGIAASGVVAVLVAVMLTLPVGPMPFWFFPELVTSLMLGFLVVAVFIAVGLAAIAWVIGKRLRPVSGAHREAAGAVPTITMLSERESDVFHLAAQGLSNAEIATVAFISEATVKSHMTRILSKLGLTSRAQLVAYAWEHQFVSAAGAQPLD